MTNIKSKLLTKQRKVARSVELEFDGGKISVDIVKPTVGDRMKAVQRAQEDGLLNSDNQPSTPVAALQFVSRLIVLLVRVDGQPLFANEDEEAILDAPFFEELAKHVQECFTPSEESIEGK
jgi:hypothetical protein